MRRVMLYLVVGALLLMAGQTAFAADEITVTVTLMEIGVDVTPTAWALGPMLATSSQSSWVSGVAGYFQATNIGNVTAFFRISASTTSPSGWLPVSTVTSIDQYQIGYGIGSDPYTVEPGYTNFTGMMLLAGNVAPSEAVDFDLRFVAPEHGSTYDPGGESFTVVLSAFAQ